MRKCWWGLGLIVLVGGTVFFWPKNWYRPFVGRGESLDLDLGKYDIDALMKRGGKASEIKIVGRAEEVEKRKKKADKFESQIFTFESEGKRISGTVNIPNPEMSSLKKAIILVRGYAELETYYPGFGSWRIAQVLANEGYATFSIDFLGYGLSEKESEDVLEARFVKVMNVMDLIESVKAIPWIDKGKIGIWAHSNGGQIALSVLETLEGRYPSVLWAPMTQTFPESVLSTIEPDSPVKGMIEEFEKKYDSRRYAFENYYSWIESPILIQQGDADEWCQVEWQEKVISGLESEGKSAELVIYPGNDHNLSRSWNEVVQRGLVFYKREFGK